MARNTVGLEEGRRLLRREKQNRQTAQLHERVREMLSELPYSAPQTEYQFHPKRKWRLDYAWPIARVALEVHGAVWSGGRHTRGQGFTNDREKMNEAQLLGWTVIEATSDQIDDGSAVRWIKEALGL